MKRLAEFLRSVTPADPAQLLFLAGTVCLVIAPRLSWWPSGFQIAPDHSDDWLMRQVWALRSVLFLPILFAGIAGYFICFWPGPRPLRRILACIYLPTAPIVAIMSLRLLFLVKPYHSVLEGVGPHNSTWSESPFFRVPGFQFCLAGLLLIGIFTARLAAGRSSLPLVLRETSVLHHDDPGTWRRVQILVWVLVGPLFLTTAFIFVPLTLSPHFVQYVRNVWFVRLGDLAQTLLILAIAVVIIGRSARQLLRRALRLPGEKSALLATGFAIGIPALISAGQYLWERAQLVRHDVATVPSEPGTYFSFPDGWWFLLFFPALAEELIFRGWLQPQFMRRYGLYRGIFLVGIVWAAFHFPSDFSFSHFDTLDAIQQLGFRLFLCMAHSFVFGWFTLETGSVLAAALAHTFYNVLLYSDLGPPFPGKNWLRITLWAVLGCVLFRYWPVATESSEVYPAAEVVD
jgi:membrane protease YdiL (CAAX protease family)